MILRLQRYVLAEVLIAFATAFFLVTGVILLAATVIFLRRYSDVALVDLLLIMPLLGAYMAVYTIPLTLLFAVIWTYSRLLQDNEITALRSCGVHLHTITAPIVLLGVLVSGGVLALFDQVIPLAHYQKRVLVQRTIVHAMERIRTGDGNQISMGKYAIFVRNVSPPPQNELIDIVIYQLESGDMRPAHRFKAPRAKVIYDSVTGVVKLQLFDPQGLVMERAGEQKGPRAVSGHELKVPLSESEASTADELLAASDGATMQVSFAAGVLEGRIARRAEDDAKETTLADAVWKSADGIVTRSKLAIVRRSGATLTLGFAAGTVDGRAEWGGSPYQLGSPQIDLQLSLDLDQEDSKGLSDLTFAELSQAYLEPAEKRVGKKLKDDHRLVTELHYRPALAFAALFFVLVGAPSAMMLRASSRVAAFGICLLKVFILYFPFVIGAKALCSSGAIGLDWIPIVLWSGNILFGVIGGLYFALLHRV